jgi:hypothetical protein
MMALGDSPSNEEKSCGLGRPRSGSERNRFASSRTSAERKLPCIVDTPFGGCAGMISMPTILPLGFVRSTAT